MRGGGGDKSSDPSNYVTGDGQVSVTGQDEKPCTFLIASRDVTNKWYEEKGRDYFCKDMEFILKRYEDTTADQLRINTKEDVRFTWSNHITSVYIDESAKDKKIWLMGGYDTITINGQQDFTLGGGGKVKKLIINTTDSSIYMYNATGLQPNKENNNTIPEFECEVTANVKNTKVWAPKNTNGYYPCPGLNNNQDNEYSF